MSNLRPPLSPPGTQPPAPPPALPIPPVFIPPTASPQLPPNLLPMGVANPPRQSPPLSTRDAREFALRALLDYLSTIPFVRIGAKGESPRAMPIPRANMYTANPGDRDLLMPSLVCLEGPAEKIPLGLAPAPDESSLHVFGRNTVLVPQWTHREMLPIEVWGSRHDELHAISGGIEGSLTPTEGILGLRLTLPEYFNQVARYTYDHDDSTVDDVGSVQNRWRAVIHIWVEVDVVRLVNSVTMLPIAMVDTELPQFSPLSVVPQSSFGNSVR